MLRKGEHVFIPFDAEGKAFTGSGKIRIFQSIDNAAKVGFFEDCLVEYAPVRRARWIPYELENPYGPCDEKTWYKCSGCGKDAPGWCYDDEYYSEPDCTRFCQNCGAVMEDEDHG